MTSRCRRRIAIEPLEARNLFAAMPLGASPADTAEFLLGRVAVTPVLFESTGQLDANTEDWSEQTIQAALAKVHEGVNWWAEALDRLDTVHSLEFVIDDTFARAPVATPYEPISRTSQEHVRYVGDFLEQQGYGDAGSLQDAVRQFNHDARVRLDTDWAFTIFIVNSANDDDGQFAAGSEFNVAFAYPGGLYMMVPSTRPASTIAHEMGHIFWTRDEYPGAGSWTDRRGYYNAPNLNAADNPTPGFSQEPSIMRSGTGLTQAYADYSLPASTMAMLGWRDSDGDGIFDLADVPLSLEGTGQYDPAAGTFSFSGYATAVPLPNQNSWGLQNDITLNRVDRIEYRLDSGPWQTAAWIAQQASEVDFTVPVDPFATIEVRAIDDRVGITSETFTSSAQMPLLAGAALGGIARVQPSGEPSSGEPLGDVTVRLAHADGSPLMAGVVDSDQLGSSGTGSLPPGIRLAGLGPVLDGRVAAVAGHSSTGTTAIGHYNRQSGDWENAWAPDKQLQVKFDRPVGSVEIDVIGLRTSLGYGRLEAYDAQGNLLTRATTAGLRAGEVETLRVRDGAGRIASVRAFGHAWTEIGLDHLRYGTPAELATDADGVFHFSGLPDGDYRLELTPQRLIHQYAGPSAPIEVRDGSSSIIDATFQRVRSPWNNPLDAYDVNGDGRVEPIDVLLVITDMGRRSPRILSDPTQVRYWIDSNNDGEVTPLDALLVLNEIARRNRTVSPSPSGESAAATATAAAPLTGPEVDALWPSPRVHVSDSHPDAQHGAAPPRNHQHRVAQAEPLPATGPSRFDAAVDAVLARWQGSEPSAVVARRGEAGQTTATAATPLEEDSLHLMGRAAQSDREVTGIVVLGFF